MTFESFALLMFLGWVATEGAVEYLLGLAFDFFGVENKYKAFFQPLASAGIGIGVAYAYDIDILCLWLGQPKMLLGIIITGIIVGRGANTIHQVAQLLGGWIKSQIRPELRPS